MLINPQYFTNIEQKNVLKNQFNFQFKNKKYIECLKTFEKIEKTSTLIEPELRLDAAHAYYLNKDTTQARYNYEMAINNPDLNQVAIALNQLGNLAALEGDTAKAINYHKTALKKKPKPYRSQV